MFEQNDGLRFLVLRSVWVDLLKFIVIDSKDVFRRLAVSFLFDFDFLISFDLSVTIVELVDKDGHGDVVGGSLVHQLLAHLKVPIRF